VDPNPNPIPDLWGWVMGRVRVRVVGTCGFDRYREMSGILRNE